MFRLSEVSVNLIHTDFSQIDSKKLENRLSADLSGAVGQTEEEKLQSILDKCELQMFSPNVAAMLTQAVERLFYSDSLKIGDARLPQSRVRSYLQLLDANILITVLGTIRILSF